MDNREPETERTARRFYKQAGVEQAGVELGEGGAGERSFALTLDGKRARTPGKATLQVPSEALARAIAAEWQVQEARIRPETMPLTRIAGTAIDKVAPALDRVRADTLAYAGTDLLCYRADAPEPLAESQAARWQPVLDWLAETHGAPLAVTSGIIAIEQPAESLAALERRLSAFPAHEMTALSLLTSTLGSLGLALAVQAHRLSPGDAWEAAFLDELWQAERWGEDREATLRRRAILEEVKSAAHYLGLLEGG